MARIPQKSSNCHHLHALPSVVHDRRRIVRNPKGFSIFHFEVTLPSCKEGQINWRNPLTCQRFPMLKRVDHPPIGLLHNYKYKRHLPECCYQGCWHICCGPAVCVRDGNPEHAVAHALHFQRCTLTRRTPAAPRLGTPRRTHNYKTKQFKNGCKY